MAIKEEEHVKKPKLPKKRVLRRRPE